MATLKDRSNEYRLERNRIRKKVLKVIGIIAGILFVVYVERIMTDGNDIIRIISARYAEKEEKKRSV